MNDLNDAQDWRDVAQHLVEAHGADSGGLTGYAPTLEQLRFAHADTHIALASIGALPPDRHTHPVPVDAGWCDPRPESYRPFPPSPAARRDPLLRLHGFFPLPSDTGLPHTGCYPASEADLTDWAGLSSSGTETADMAAYRRDWITEHAAAAAVARWRARADFPGPVQTQPRSSAMPDPDDRMTTWPEAGSPGNHPVLEAMAEAVGVVSDTAAYLSPTREFDEPSLEEGDWPRDLDGPETLRMVGHLADVAYGASRCITGISCQHAIPDAAKPQLDVIADLLADAGRKLSALTGTPGRQQRPPARHSTLALISRLALRLARPLTLPGQPCQEPQPRPPLVLRSRHHDTRPVSDRQEQGQAGDGQPGKPAVAWAGQTSSPSRSRQHIQFGRCRCCGHRLRRVPGHRPGDPRHLAWSPEVSRRATASWAPDGAAAHSRPLCMPRQQSPEGIVRS